MFVGFTGPSRSGSASPVNSHLKKFALLCGLFFVSLATSSLAQSHNDFDSPNGEPTVEEVIGRFDKNEVLHNEAEKAYSLPDIGAFAAYFPATGDLATGISIELHDRRYRRGLLNWFKYDLFISEQRLGLALGRKLIPVVDVTFSAVYSRDFDRNEDVWGFSFGLIKF